MIDWLFAWKLFFISILGTFIVIGALTLIIRLTSIFYPKYFRNDADLKD